MGVGGVVRCGSRRSRGCSRACRHHPGPDVGQTPGPVRGDPGESRAGTSTGEGAAQVEFLDAESGRANPRAALLEGASHPAGGGVGAGECRLRVAVGHAAGGGGRDRGSGG